MKKYKKMIENKEFITTKRNRRFYMFVAEYFKDVTKWFPKCTIHHLDENPCNNHPLNLSCMTKAEHCSIHRKGKARSEETIIKMRESNIGKHHTAEAIAKMCKPYTLDRIANITKYYIIINDITFTIVEASNKFSLNLNSLKNTIYKGRTKYNGLEFKVVTNINKLMKST